MNIVSFKALQKKVNAEVLVTDKDGTKSVDPRERKVPPHEDLLTALNLLKPHLVILFGIVRYKDWEVMDEYQKNAYLDTVHPHGYALGGKDHDEGVTLTGHRIIDGGFSTNIVTPYRRFEEKAETAYPDMEKLQTDLKIIHAEAKEYVDGTKRGTNGQTNLPFKEGNKAGTEKRTNDKITKAHIAEPLHGDEGGGLVASTIPTADPELQKDLKDKKPAGGKKRVAQTASNRSGIVNENNG